MNPLQKIADRFRAPQLTRGRAVLALTLALGADAVQILLGPLGWTFLDEGIDLIMMVATCGLIGFHWLLLPTFLVEVVPIVDMLPTWTGCVVAVITLRRRKPGSEFRVHAAPAAAVPEPPEVGTPNGGGVRPPPPLKSSLDFNCVRRFPVRLI